MCREASFIENVHTLKTPENSKLLCMQKTMDFVGPRGEDLKDLFNGIDWSKDAYFNVIRELVAEYGGAERLRLRHKRRLKELGKFLRTLLNWIQAERRGGKAKETLESEMFKKITKKFSAQHRAEYLDWIESNQDIESIESFSLWCEWRRNRLKRVEILGGELDGDKEKKKKNKQKPKKPPKSLLDGTSSDSEEEKERFVNSTQTKRPCDLCEGDHFPLNCSQYESMNLENRWGYILKTRRCFSCGRFGHLRKDWQVPTGGCRTCGKKSHHTSLHGIEAKQAKHFANFANYAEEYEEKVYKASVPNKEEDQVALKITPMRVTVGMRSIMLNALIDDGSTAVFLSTRAAAKLQLEGKEINLNLKTIREEERLRCMQAEVKLSSVDGTFSKKVDCTVMDNILEGLRAVDWEEEKKNWSHLKELKFPKPATTFGYDVDIMIGVNKPQLVACKEERIGGENEPVARKLVWGWTAYGPTGGTALKHLQSHSTVEVKVNLEKARKKSKLIETVLLTEKSTRVAATNGGIVRAYCVGIRRAECIGTPPRGEPNLHPNKEDISNAELIRMLKAQWEIENHSEPVVQEDLYTKDEKRVIQTLKAALGPVQEDGRLEMPVLWKPGEPFLPNNKQQAIARLNSLDKILDEQGLRDKYNKVLDEWIELGIAEEVTKDTPEPEEGREFYLPHFPVVRQEAVSTKIRVVMDGKCRFRGKGLNDAVHAGPNLLNNLLQVLTRARKNIYLATSDVSKMFLRIKMPLRDRSAHRFLWRREKGEKIIPHHFIGHVFGNKGSPCVALFSVKQTALDMKEEMPRAAETVLKSTVMDDNIDAYVSVGEAKTTNKDLATIYGRCGLSLGKYAASHEEILEEIPPEKRASVMMVENLLSEDDEVPDTRLLGLLLDFSRDTFSFKVERPEEEVWTKRKLVKFYSKIFDPLGFIAPATIVAKIIFQSCWRDKLEWDEDIGPEKNEAWAAWLLTLDQIGTVQVPRCLRNKDPALEIEETTLHVFGDASGEAFAYCAYVRTVYTGGKVEVKLACANARLAPLQAQCIARLELMAATLALDALKIVNSVYQLPLTDIHFYCDNRTVLAWIQSESRNLKVFVSHRVSKIQQRSEIDNWHWVPSESNPADYPSRGKTPAQLVSLPMWWEGPDFLQQQELVHAPKDPPVINEEVLSEMKRDTFSFHIKESKGADESNGASVEPSPLGGWSPKKFKSFNSYINTLAYCRRVLKWFRSNRQSGLRGTPYKAAKRESLIITTSEREAAVLLALEICQRESFSDDYGRLQCGKRVKANSPLAPLSPFLCRGVIRASSRAEEADSLAEEAKYPAILPSRGDLVEALIDDVHSNLLRHASFDNTWNEIKQRFIIMQGRTKVKSHCWRCVTCQHKRSAKALQMTQRMAALPKERLQGNESTIKPFATTYMDCAGPFLVSMGKRRAKEKRYMLLFTCSQYRAVHIELLEAMDLESLVVGINCFLARRPRPLKILTDRGTNFKACQRELRRLWKRIEHTKLAEKFPQIDWKFNPPYSPHWGGAFESLIKCAKQSLMGVLSGGDLKDGQLRAAFTLTEGVLNSRPLAYTGTGSDPCALTPGHFLKGEPHEELFPRDELETTLGRKYKALQEKMECFWKRFMREIPSYWHRRAKWRNEKKNLKACDVVMVLDERSDRGHWPLGLVEDVQVGRDGLVRAASVRVKGRLIERSLTRLSLLRNCEDEEQ